MARTKRDTFPDLQRRIAMLEDAIRLIGRLTADAQIEAICKDAMGGRLFGDTDRLDWIEKDEITVEQLPDGRWRASGFEDYVADTLRGAIDKGMRR